jgi:sigma-B regulation protein RsbU (phosphoserine phosphatase)
LLPAKLPDSDKARFAWSFRPCDELAGDNLNVFKLDDHFIGMFVADVSGHGVAAALLSVTISQLLSPQKSDHGLLVKPNREDASKCNVSSPLDVIAELNRRFPMEDFEGNYFTIIYGVLNTQTCEFRYASAGHPPFILISEGQSQVIENRGFPIGWVTDGQYEEHTIQLKPGDRLCFYTDGIADAENVQQEKFGDARLLESLISTVSNPIDDSVTQAMLKIETWCGKNGAKDDMSMLVIEITD